MSRIQHFALAGSLLAAVCLFAISSIAHAQPFAVSVNIDPETLDIASSGKYVTAFIQFPEDREADTVNLSSVMIQAIDRIGGELRYIHDQALQVGRAPGSPVAFIDANGEGVLDQLMLKFDRATVASWATGAPELVLRIEGQFTDGRYFSGDTQIRITRTP